MRSRTAVLVIFALFMSSYAQISAQSKVGTSAATFLGIGVGPKAIGLGGAFVAIADDASALYWNPGGISRPGHSEALISHTNWLVGTKFDWAGVVVNIDGSNAVGASFTMLDYGEEEITTTDYQNGTGETWSASDISIGLSYARNLTDRFSIGGTAKYIQQRIWNESASSIAFDVGLLFITGFNDLKIGMSIANFGGEMRLDGKDLYNKIDLDPTTLGNNDKIISVLRTDYWPLPLLFRAGVSMDVFKQESFRLTVAADALRPSDNAEVVNCGGEFAWNEAIFLRAGLKSLFLEESEESITLGAGARYELTAANIIGLNYCYQDFGVFGGLQTFALSVTF